MIGSDGGWNGIIDMMMIVIIMMVVISTMKDVSVIAVKE